MAYVIVDTCTKDEHCIEACPVNCIHPTKDEADFESAAQLYVHPEDCWRNCRPNTPVAPRRTQRISPKGSAPGEMAAVERR